MKYSLHQTKYIHREVGQAKDLSAPWYKIHLFLSNHRISVKKKVVRKM